MRQTAWAGFARRVAPGGVVLAFLGVLDLLTHEVQRVMTSASRWPTVMSMAALGLGVDIRTVGRVGSHISVAVTASLLVLIVTGRALICFVGRA